LDTNKAIKFIEKNIIPDDSEDADKIINSLVEDKILNSTNINDLIDKSEKLNSNKNAPI